MGRTSGECNRGEKNLTRAFRFDFVLESALLMDSVDQTEFYLSTLVSMLGFSIRVIDFEDN